MQDRTGKHAGWPDERSLGDDSRYIEDRRQRNRRESAGREHRRADERGRHGGAPQAGRDRDDLDAGQRGPEDWHRYSRFDQDQDEDGQGQGRAGDSGGPRRGHPRGGVYHPEPGRYGGYGGLREPAKGGDSTIHRQHHEDSDYHQWRGDEH